jgi:NAD(P)-dependent dehydrogenase (short-subunit alcohol dehydrogenase family)
MPGRLANKTAIIVGAGQTPGETIGNGRAMAILFAREGATVMCVDRRLDSAQETVAMIEAEGHKALAFEADITKPADCAAIAREGVIRLSASTSWSTMSAPAAATPRPMPSRKKPGTTSWTSTSNR